MAYSRSVVQHRSSMRRGLAVSGSPALTSIKRQRRKGASGVRALQCASGRAARARLGRVSAPWIAPGGGTQWRKASVEFDTGTQ